MDDESGVIYTSRELHMPKTLDAPILGDLGAGVTGDDKHLEVIQPNVYGAPDVIFGGPWSRTQTARQPEPPSAPITTRILNLPIRHSIPSTCILTTHNRLPLSTPDCTTPTAVDDHPRLSAASRYLSPTDARPTKCLTLYFPAQAIDWGRVYDGRTREHVDPATTVGRLARHLPPSPPALTLDDTIAFIVGVLVADTLPSARFPFFRRHRRRPVTVKPLFRSLTLVSARSAFAHWDPRRLDFRPSNPALLCR
ncbi:hypothetical protein F4808DRAFT_473173 [Astrocystis sublimbata]|nr:hypothetical protein F4808DRAFT_473173 [Astrocystis sublimbata]